MHHVERELEIAKLKLRADYWAVGYWILTASLGAASLWTSSKLVTVIAIYAVTAPTVLRLLRVREWLEGD